MNSAFDVKKPAGAPPVPPPNPTLAVGGLSAAFPAPSRHAKEEYNGGGDSFQPRTVQLHGNVGFNSLPQQLVTKAMGHGFTFNILCVGETGIGKTTMMESLFNMDLQFQPSTYELNKIELRTKTYDVQESGVCLKLTIVETAGFGDQLDKEGSANVIVNHINEQYEKYMQEEMKIRRNLSFYQDTRVHACIYFISPTGHGLKALDVVTLKELSKRVNVIPVIAKADTTSKEELKRFKAKILAELRTNGVEMYKFPEDDETVKKINADLNASVPFAVVGSNDFVMKDGKKVRARSYPWGMVEVENESHCDFVKLREALLRVNVEDLRERTHRVLYETYRKKRLLEMGLKDSEMGTKMGQTLTTRMQTLKEELVKQEQSMKEEFCKVVEKKDRELKQTEDEMKSKYQNELKKLERELEEMNQDCQKIDKEFEFYTKRKAEHHTTGTKKRR